MAVTITSLLLALTLLKVSLLLPPACGLAVDHHNVTCPNLESIVFNVVEEKFQRNPTVAPGLLRMHFHDCFVSGCDGSVLLNSTVKHKAEKDGPPNLSLHAFFVIHDAKEAVENECPGVVSCADILALAARDAVVLTGGPRWDVPKGRLDAVVSKESDTRQLPAPTFNYAQLSQSFSSRGLTTQDLVALSGSHTIGFAHCSSFNNRLYSFNSTNGVDPSMSPDFAAKLQDTCPKAKANKDAGSNLDFFSPRTFDNGYYKLFQRREVLLTSDQSLFTNATAQEFVRKFAGSQDEFFTAFTEGMIKMSSFPGKGVEIRRTCEKINKLIN